MRSLRAISKATGRFVLPKPVQESELDRVLRGIETAAPSGKVINIRNIVA